MFRYEKVALAATMLVLAFICGMLTVNRPVTTETTTGVFYAKGDFGTVYEDGSFTIITNSEVIKGCIIGSRCDGM